MNPLDRLFAAIYRRGQSIVDARDQSLEERRAAVRHVRDAIRDAMTSAEEDREHGRDSDRAAAVSRANEASATAHEMEDETSRELVGGWKAKFDAIQKGWKEGGLKSISGEARHPRGYPEPAWSDLREAADAAQTRLGEVLRALLAETS